MKRLFGTDGIRGTVGQYPMTAEMALLVGRACASLFKRKGHNPKIVIGKDTRLSGYIFEYALAAGLCSVGVNPILVGVMPTPAVAFLTSSMRADAGMVVSASHNPVEDNGIKIFGGDGFKLSDEAELVIEELVLSPGGSPATSPTQIGKAYRLEDARGRYIVFLKNSFPKELSLEGMKVVLDCAHGAAYRVAPETFFELGAEVSAIFDKPDGLNINVNCGSQHPRSLADEVVRRKAQVGFAFDGDGDRVIAVDEEGKVLTGDQILAVLARQLKNEGRLANNMVVRTVMSNIGLGLALDRLGIDSTMTQVGDRYVLGEMLARGAVLGGEDSGHLVVLPYHTTGDGIITALQVAAAMRKTGQPLSELAKIMEVFPQKLVNVEVKTKKNLSSVPAIVRVIREVESQLGRQGRVLVRYSGTQNLCRIMVEAPTEEEASRYCELIARVVKAELGES